MEIIFKMIVTAYFAREEIYNDLFSVFIRSAKDFMPDKKIKVLQLKPPKFIDHQRDAAISFLSVANYVFRKNKPAIITGIDSLFLKSIYPLLDKVFDIAISMRNHKVRYNTGLWAYHPTKKAKTFLSKWIKITKLLLNKFDEFENEIHLYGGIDQLSLLITLLVDKTNLHIKKLPCQEWNATQSEWRDIDNNTRMIHVKSQLRVLLQQKKIEYDKSNRHLEPIIEKWRSYLK